MNIHLEMFDLETSERLAQGNGTYVLNFKDAKDAGFRFILSWIYSCVRGIRIKNMNAIELRIHFIAPCEKQSDMFEGVDTPSFAKDASNLLT